MGWGYPGGLPREAILKMIEVERKVPPKGSSRDGPAQSGRGEERRKVWVGTREGEERTRRPAQLQSPEQKGVRRASASRKRRRFSRLPRHPSAREEEPLVQPPLINVHPH